MRNGFTLTEMLVALAVFVLMVEAVYAGFLLSQRAWQEGESSSELAQNGRVVLERMTREIRQARDLVGDLPDSQDNATSTLEFEDGNRSERYHYIRYFQAGQEIKREVKRYYFSGDPDTFVPWSATPPPGQEMLFLITEEAQIIGEFVRDLKVWISEINIINVVLVLEKGGKQTRLATKVFGRNL